MERKRPYRIVSVLTPKKNEKCAAIQSSASYEDRALSPKVIFSIVQLEHFPSKPCQIPFTDSYPNI